jgi:hypothetical protein
MLPIILALAGGYLIVDSQKEKLKFEDGGEMADGGKMAKGGSTKSKFNGYITIDNKYLTKAKMDGVYKLIEQDNFYDNTQWVDGNKTNFGFNFNGQENKLNQKLKDLFSKLKNINVVAKTGEINEAFEDGGMMAKGGILIPQQGTLYTKDKKSKLEYYKKGNDYAFKVYDVENNPVENYTRNQYKKRSDEEALMTYNQFINYLYSELYIDDKMAMGGEITFDEKVKAVKSSLLKRKKVSPKVQKDYGKTYSPKEAEESAKRIVGSQVSKWKERMGKK